MILIEFIEATARVADKINIKNYYEETDGPFSNGMPLYAKYENFLYVLGRSHLKKEVFDEHDKKIRLIKSDEFGRIKKTKYVALNGPY